MLLMRIHTALALMLLAPACAPVSGTPKRITPLHINQWSLQVIEQLNGYRIQHGLNPLQEHAGLHGLCIEHSRWLKDKRGTSMIHGSNVSHSGSNYRARVARIRHEMEDWGENVAFISQPADDVAAKLIVMWKGSPGHAQAMLGNWTHVGIGISADQDNAIFAVMNFARRKPYNYFD